MQPEINDIIRAGREAMKRGWTPIPVRDRSKKPYGATWQTTRWESSAQMEAAFRAAAEQGAPGIGLLVGEPSGGLIDVDIDHPMAWRLREHFLPRTPMQHGREHSPRSHRWFIADRAIPATRRYKMADGEVSVELRSTGGQTVIPPSVWWGKEDSEKGAQDSEPYRWEGVPWGGKAGPTHVDGTKLSVQVALLGLGAVLLNDWPKAGSRHDAYLALAGALLRYGETVHPFWERNIAALIEGLADASHDDDAESRVSETVASTIRKLHDGDKVFGWPTLSEMLGEPVVKQAMRMVKEVEQRAGFNGDEVEVGIGIDLSGIDTARANDPFAVVEHDAEPQPDGEVIPTRENPMENRESTWSAVDLGPYLRGEYKMPEPGVLYREDGKGVFYPGMVNSIFGLSESCKSWIALETSAQRMRDGERVVYVDLEDMPLGTVDRMKRIGAATDDVTNLFTYVHPEGPIANLQRYRNGDKHSTDGLHSAKLFNQMLREFDPALIIVDGMTALYGLHGHDTNEASSTDVITTWLKKLCRGGRTTVIVIDHTGKNGGAGSSPIGAHHKIAMVQGTALRAEPVVRPMQGELGSVRLVVYKDRPGAVRMISTKASEQIAATIELDSREEGVTKIRVMAPDPAEFVGPDDPKMAKAMDDLAIKADHMEAIMRLFGGDIDKELSTKEVAEALGCSQNHVRYLWGEMVSIGQVEPTTASPRGRRYRLAVSGR